MKNSRRMLLLALLSLLVYVTDVIAGAYYKAAFLSDLASLLTLLITSVAFTVAIVGLERREASRSCPHHD